jgi:hypothetical protein
MHSSSRALPLKQALVDARSTADATFGECRSTRHGKALDRARNGHLQWSGVRIPQLTRTFSRREKSCGNCWTNQVSSKQPSLWSSVGLCEKLHSQAPGFPRNETDLLCP